MYRTLQASLLIMRVECMLFLVRMYFLSLFLPCTLQYTHLVLFLFNIWFCCFQHHPFFKEKYPLYILLEKADDSSWISCIKAYKNFLVLFYFLIKSTLGSVMLIFFPPLSLATRNSLLCDSVAVRITTIKYITSPFSLATKHDGQCRLGLFILFLNQSFAKSGHFSMHNI